LRTTKIFRDKWHDVASDSQNQKRHVALKKASISNSKAEWTTYLAPFPLISL